MVWGRVQLHNWHMKIQLCQHYLLKRLFLPPNGIVLTPLSKFSWPECKGAFLDSILFHWTYVSLLPVLHSLDYCSWVLSLETRNSSPICSFSSLFWLFWAPCICTWILESGYQFLQKRSGYQFLPLDFLLRIAFNQSIYSFALFNIKSSSLWTVSSGCYLT